VILLGSARLYAAGRARAIRLATESPPALSQPFQGAADAPQGDLQTAFPVKLLPQEFVGRPAPGYPSAFPATDALTSMRKVLLALALVACCGARADDAANPPAFWGSPSVDGGRCCATLAEVRGNIDRIDHAIVALMAERGQYVAEAGRFKKDPAAVSAPARVEAIIAKVRADATAQGLDPTVAERTWRAMIAAFEDFERAEWTRHHGQAPAK
jgi:isochorismate pyruvate lyase